MSDENLRMSSSPSSPQPDQSQDTDDTHDEQPASVDEDISDSTNSTAPGNQDDHISERNDSNLDEHYLRSDGPSSPLYSTQPPSPTRPNKHHGPPSTWRSWTVAERELAASLDQLGAKDLAVHLFNAFALKRRAKRLEQGRNDDRVDREQEWVPPKIWAAWPLTPDNIPRQDNDRQCQADNLFSLDKDLTSCERLRESVISRVLNYAKHEFWDWERQHPSLPKGTVAPGSDSQGLKNHQKGPSFSEAEPVFLADDDVARRILQPTTHHILTKLDDLLRGLHHARSAALLTKSNSRNKVIAENTKPRPRKSRVDIPKSKGRGEDSRKPSPFLISKAGYSLKNQPHFSAAHKRQRSYSDNQHARLPQMNRKHGLRDWSDILGVAMMIDWDSKSAQRAAVRCATLFEEEISLRTLHENGRSVLENAGNGSAGNKEHDNDATTRVPYTQHSEGNHSTLICLVKNCKSFSEEFSTQDSLKRHMRKMHKEFSPSALPTEPVQKESEKYGVVHIDGFLQPVTLKVKKQRDSSESYQSNH